MRLLVVHYLLGVQSLHYYTLWELTSYMHTLQLTMCLQSVIKYWNQKVNVCSKDYNNYYTIGEFIHITPNNYCVDHMKFLKNVYLPQP